jgi:hypothetical protein
MAGADLPPAGVAQPAHVRIVAVPIGLLVRTVLLGSPRGAKILMFVGIGLAFTLLFLVLGRLVVRLVSRGW